MTEADFNAQSGPYPADIRRLLPQSADAEQGLICSILLSPKEVCGLCYDRGITDKHFHIPAHQEIFTVLQAMWAAEKPIDLVTLTAELRKAGRLDTVGGPAFITHLFTFLPTASNASYYVELLEEKALDREIISVGTEYAGRAYDEGDSQDLLSQFKARVAAIGEIGTVKEPAMRENIMAATKHLEDRTTGKGIVLTGLPAFDHDIGPLERGMLFVIGGQTKAAKSILASQIMLNAAERGTPGLYISLEMTELELTMRMLASIARVNTRPMEVERWTDADRIRWAKASAHLDSLPVKIATGLYKLPQIVAKCQRASAASKGG